MEFQNATIALCVKRNEPDAVIVGFILEDETAFRGAYEKRKIIDFQGNNISAIDPDSLIDLKRKRNSKQDQLDIEELRGKNPFMKIYSEEAIVRLKKTAELRELYFELSKFEFTISTHKNAAKIYFSKINEALAFYKENSKTPA